MTRRSDDDSEHPTTRAPPGETDDFEETMELLHGLLTSIVSTGCFLSPQNVFLKTCSLREKIELECQKCQR